MGELDAARYRAELEELHAIRREGGWELLTRWIRRVLQEQPHGDLRRVELVDPRTIVVTTFSGMVGTVYVDAAEPCAWCRGGGLARVPSGRPPCEGCLGTGLGGRQRGAVAAPTGAGADDLEPPAPPRTAATR